MREALAAREETIGSLVGGMAMDRALLQRQSEQLREADHFAAEVAEMVGREAIIAGEPVTLDYKWNQQLNGNRIAARPYMPINILDRPCDKPELARLEIMHLLDVKSVRDVMSYQMHAHVTLADETVGYAISQTALKRMTEAELARTILPQIARLLASQLKLRWR